jgi:inosine-uridine nucleoside N-ribohydrolase
MCSRLTQSARYRDVPRGDRAGSRGLKANRERTLPRKIILDVDTGTDDAVAIMLAALHPDLELVACTVVNGNTSVDHCTNNTLRVLDHIGFQHVPVYRGLDRPLVRRDLPKPRQEGDVGSKMHGTALALPDSKRKAEAKGAIEFLVEMYRAATEEITLVPVAPLTNIAAALAVEPRLVDQIPQIVIMGGSHAFGNITAAAEFNIWADPESAAVVFNAGFKKITLVPLDATYKATFSKQDCTDLDNLGTPAGRAAAMLIGQRIKSYDEIQPLEVAGYTPVHDALAVAAVLDRSLISTQYLHVDVETAGAITLGRTVIDTQFRGASRSRPANCHVAFDADAIRFRALLKETFAKVHG